MDKESVSTQRAPIDAAPVAVITSSVCTYILYIILSHTCLTTSLGQVLHLVRVNLIRGSFFEVVRWIPIAVLSGLNLWTGMQALTLGISGQILAELGFLKLIMVVVDLYVDFMFH